MSRKILVKLIAASFALAGIDAAMACSITAWSNTGAGGGPTGAPIPGEPDDANDTDPANNVAVARYSGRCALLSNAPNNFVTDVSPAAEPSYIAQFYVFTGVTGAGEVDVFQALNASNSPVIRVSYDGTNMRFRTSNATASTLAALPASWYRVRLNWKNNAAMEVQIQGARAAVQNTTVGAPNPADTVDSARLGWIAGTNTGSIITDVFESRRNTLPVPACRGDANADGIISVLDRGRITGEVAGTLLGLGQPDCREDGNVNVTDRGCVTGLVAAATNCPTAAP